jgi:hypothetical protein
MLSNVVFKFNLRPYIAADVVSPVALEKALLRISISKKNKLSLLEYPGSPATTPPKVRRCRLTPG